MKLKPVKFVPALIAASVILTVCLLEGVHRVFPSLDLLQRLEWITYDWRVRQAFKFPAPAATNLGAILVDELGLKAVNENFGYKWAWPRKLHGALLQELTAAGAKAVGFDILFSELDPSTPDTEIKLPNGRSIASDEYFALQLRRASNVVLGAFGETLDNRWHALMPAGLFATNALAVGHVTSDLDSDGVLRRAAAFKDDPEQGRLWHLGIILAAKELNLDLAKAIVELRRIILRGKGGVERIIPVDEQGFFYINWTLTWNDPRLAKAGFHEVIGLGPEDLKLPGWRNKILVVGSVGAGNNISDIGATSLSKTTYLISKHWNVANSIITGRFVRLAGTPVDLALIVLLGLIGAGLTWNLRAPWPTIWVIAICAGYVAVAFLLYAQSRLWIPIVLPVVCSLLMTHVATVTYQVVFEQKDKRRVKSVFEKLVSPNVVNELLEAKTLNLGGARRKITVFFADVRGFTEMTDVHQAQAAEYVREKNLSGEAAETVFDEQARETLNTVNIYLATIADQIKKHNGTLDKYIGDCVMGFWGAPTPNEQHALCCVRAAVDAQRAMHALNQQRAAENRRREQENAARVAAGQRPLPLLPLLSLGTGINTGVVTVGLMGSEAHTFNYTVFGREVNLASRLEGVSGHGRIIIGEATYREILRDDPALAATCVEQPPERVKGFQKPVKIYEVLWNPPEPAATDAALPPAATSQPAANA